MPISQRTLGLFEQMMSKGILDTPNLSKIKAPNTGAQDYVSYMLQHTTGDKKVAKMFGQSIASRESAESEKASLLSTLFDTLSVPLHAAGNVVQGGLEKGLDLAGDVGINLPGAYHQKPEGLGKDLLDLALNQPEAVAKIPGSIGKIIQKSQLHNPVSGAFAQLPSNKEVSGQNILHEDLGVNNKIGRYGGGFALDLAMDPLSYVGVGIGKKIAETPEKILDLKAAVGDNPLVKKPEVQLPAPQAVPVAEEAVKNPMVPDLRGTIPEIPHQDISQFTQGFKFDPAPPELSRRFAIQNDKIATDVERGLADIPNPARNSTQKMQRAQNDWERAMIKTGQVADNSGQVSVRAANQVVNDILTGKASRYAVKAPRAATVESATAARDTADKLIDSLMGSKRSPKGTFQKRLGIKEVNPAQQVTLFSKILGTAGHSNMEEARAMLATAEDHMIALGVQPLGVTGTRIRLSDVLEATAGDVPVKTVLEDFVKKDVKKMSAPVRAAIQGLNAQRTLTMSELTANLSKLTEDASKSLLNYTPKARPAVEKEILDTAVGQAMQKGMTSAEIKAVLDLGKQIIDVDKLPAETRIYAMQKELVRATSEGRVDTKVLDKVNNAIADSLGTTYANLGTKITDNKAIDGIMTRVAANWGKGEFLNYSKDVFVAGEEIAAARAEAMRNIAMNYDPAEVKAAWNHATNALVSDDPKALHLANFFTDYMDQVFKVQWRGLHKTNPLNAQASVAERSITMMEDINRHLKDMNGSDAFQFSAKMRGRSHNPAAPVQDFSKPGDWLKSWSAWEPNDPVAFMFNLDSAMERTVREYAFLDEFAARFGSLTKDAERTFEMPLKRVKGFYVEPEVGKQMLRVMSDMRKGNWRAGDPVTRFLSKAQRVWKTGVTIYLPSHHIRNGIGDTYLMWLAGHNDPRAFIRARRVMASQRTRYKDAIKRSDFTAIDELTDPAPIKWAATEGKNIIIKQNGINVSADQIYRGAFNLGLLRDANKMEDIFGEAPLGEVSATKDGFKRLLAQPLGGVAHKSAMAAAEYREHYIRLSHFISAVDKGLKKNKNLKQVMEAAAHEVRKWHPDGTDLTYFEQKYLRNIIPFYSWVRKSTPLLIQGLVQRPAKQLAYPRAMVAMQGMMGIEGTSLNDPYPDDQLFPEWIRSYGIGPIGDPESPNPFVRWWGNLGTNMVNPDGSKYGYTVINPSNPFIDAGQQYLGFGPKDTAAGIKDGLSPFIKVPFELMSNQDTFGAPITQDAGGQGVLHYLSKQIPFTAPFQRVTNVGDRERVGVEPGMDKEALINLMTALGVRGTGPYIKSAQFEAKEAAKNGN